MLSSHVAFWSDGAESSDSCPKANGVKITEMRIIPDKKTDLNTVFGFYSKLLILLLTFKSESYSENLTSIQTVGEQAGSQMALAVSPIYYL